MLGQRQANGKWPKGADRSNGERTRQKGRKGKSVKKREGLGVERAVKRQKRRS